MDPNTPVDTSGLYRDITDFAEGTPEWTQHIAELWTEGGLLLFGVLFVVAWWRSRHSESRALAVAVLAPLATAFAYVCSEVIKSGIEEERPCRAVSGAATSLVSCPPVGDWSFPSNHATIAGAAAVALMLAWRGIGWLTLPMAVLMAFSRVFVGVHYPHDVLVGLLFGAAVVVLVVKLTTGPGARVVESMRGSSASVVRWFAGPGLPQPPAPRPGTTVPAPYQGVYDARSGYAGGYEGGYATPGHRDDEGYRNQGGHGAPDGRNGVEGYGGYPHPTGYGQQAGAQHAPYGGPGHSPHDRYPDHPGHPAAPGHPDARPGGPAS